MIEEQQPLGNTAGNLKDYGSTQNSGNFNHLNGTQINLNGTGNTSAASLLLTNILNNISDKEVTQNQSFIQTYNSINMLKQESQGSSNALYQFLKNKHLSKEIQNRLSSNEPCQNKDRRSLSKNGSKQNINTSDYKQENLKQSKYGLELEKQKKQAYKKHETNSTLSKGSSSENTPNKYGLKSQHSSLKKVKSQSLFQKIQNNPIAKDRSSSQSKNEKYSPVKKTNNTSSNINILFDQSINLTQTNNVSNTNKDSRSKQQQHLGMNNNALTQNWMNSFLEQYDMLKVQGSQGSGKSNGAQQLQNRPGSSYNSYQKFLNTSQTNNSNNNMIGNKTNSATNQKSSSISIALNKSTSNNSTQPQVKHGQNSKATVSLQHRRSSGAQNSTVQNNNATLSQSSLNKSYNQNKPQTCVQNGSQLQQVGQINNLNKSLKKNLSFIAIANNSNLSQHQSTQSQANFQNMNNIYSTNQQQSNNNSTASTSKQPSAHLNSTKITSLFQAPQPIQQSNYPSNSKYSSINYHKAINRKKSSLTTAANNLNKSICSSSINQTNKRTSDHLKHNQSMIIGCQNSENLNKITIGDNSCFQFDDILKNLDRQVETHVNQAKKFNLSSEESTPIKYKQESRTSQIFDNQSSNRLDSLFHIMKQQSTSEEKHKLINDIFNEIITNQKISQDSQSLQIIKEYYQRELSQHKQRCEDASRLKDQIENERSKRLEAEKKMNSMYDELKQQKACIQKQEDLVNQLKGAFEKLQQSENHNKSLMKQLYSQSEVGKPSNHYLNSSQLQRPKEQPVFNNPHSNQNQYEHKLSATNIFHSKNKSAAAVIPKLDLSKIKRDVDFETENNQEVETYSDQEDDFDSILVTEDNLLHEEIKLEDFTDDEDRQAYQNCSKNEAAQLRELDLVNRKNQIMMMLSDIKSSNKDDSFNHQSNFNTSNENVLKKPLIPLLDFSKLKGTTSTVKSNNTQQINKKHTQSAYQSQSTFQQSKQPQYQSTQPLNKQHNLSLGGNQKPGLKLNLECLKKNSLVESNCFQEEFMAKIDEYSQSWREAAIREQRH